MPLAQDKVEKALRAKGFRKSDNDHRYFVFYDVHGGKTTIKTKTSHGRGITIGDSLVSEMARQCGVTRAEFRDLVECPLSRERYEHLLRDRSKI